MLVFDDGKFSEANTTLISDWTRHTHPEGLAIHPSKGSLYLLLAVASQPGRAQEAEFQRTPPGVVTVGWTCLAGKRIKGLRLNDATDICRRRRLATCSSAMTGVIRMVEYTKRRKRSRVGDSCADTENNEANPDK